MRSFGSSQARGRRSVPRAQAPVIAVLSSSAGDHPTALIDVSRTGARVGGEVLPPLGEQLTFTAVDVHASGDVVWRDADICGIEFGTPIAVSEVQRIRSAAALGEPEDSVAV